MLSFLRNSLTENRIDAIEKQAVEAAEAGEAESAVAALKPLLRAQRHQREAAERLCSIIERRYLPAEHGLSMLSEVHDAWPDDAEMLALIGESIEGARDIDQLNLAPPAHPLFETIVDKLDEAATAAGGTDRETRVLSGLATAARMLARQRDEVAERSYRRLVELDPVRSSYHYNLGLFLKTRGRFEEGMQANRAARSLVTEPVESYDWNFGICATGAGDGEAALDVWKRMGQKIEPGRFGLPEGGYPQCKVRLAQRPLAERDADADDPGLEETVWIQRLSPCHGIVRSVLFQDLGIDFGDVVLFDGAPITYHRYDDEDIPVFPHLATLVHRHYRVFDFAGTQQEAGQLADISRDLDDDAIVYSHSENYRVLCATCWRDPDLDHDRHEQERKHVVTGRIATPAHYDPERLLAQIDAGVESRGDCSLYVPELLEQAGQSDRAAVARRRLQMLKSD